MTRLALLTTVAAIGLAAVPAARAQMVNPGRTGAQPVVMPKDGGARQAPEPPPKALPGSRAEPTEVAPADKTAMDLPPTEALFDAINRGDLATAKDAVNRGADLAGHNILGLTPLEQSVDLGRNEITFLLLSLRGTTAGSNANVRRPGVPQQAAAAQPSRAEKAAQQRAERAEKAARTRAAAVVDSAPAAPRTAHLFAGNGGAPVPQAGFLGFDSTR